MRVGNKLLGIFEIEGKGTLTWEIRNYRNHCTDI